MSDTSAQYITHPTPSQIDHYAALAHQAFVMPLDRLTDRLQQNPSAIRVITSNDQLVGGLFIHDDAQRFARRNLRTWGIALVVVAPHFRGRSRGQNFGRSLMQSTLQEAHLAGVPLLSLYASTPAFYRRLGFDIAGQLIHWRAPLHKLPLENSDAVIEPIDPANTTAELAAYAAAVADSNGPLALCSAELQRRAFQPDHIEVHPYRIRFADSVEGYVIPELSRSDSTLRIWRQAIATPRAAHAALAFFAEHRTMFDRVDWIGSPADPLRLLIPANATLHSMEEWYLRIVNVESALLQRGYPAVHCELHMDITDDILPQNSRRLVLTLRNGKATIQPGGTGRIALHIRALAPIYSSHLSPFDLHRVGQISAPPDDLHALALAFAGPQPHLLDRF